MTAGLPIKFYTVDDSAMFKLTRLVDNNIALSPSGRSHRHNCSRSSSPVTSTRPSSATSTVASTRTLPPTLNDHDSGIRHSLS